MKNRYKKYDTELSLTNTQIKNLQEARNEIIKHNADVSAMNRDEVLKFEQALKTAHANRLHLEQQPNESELDYYNRLRAIEQEKYDPVLYKQYAENEQTKTLKTNLNSLFDNMGFNEEILSKLPAEDKYIINKIFDEIEEAFLDNFGYNNARISPKQAAKALKTFADVYKNESASKLQSVFRGHLDRNKALVEKSRREYENQERNPNEAANKLQSVFRGHLDRNKALVEKSRQEYENQERNANEAANKLQSVFRGHLDRNKALVKQIKTRI